MSDHKPTERILIVGSKPSSIRTIRKGLSDNASFNIVELASFQGLTEQLQKVLADLIIIAVSDQSIAEAQACCREIRSIPAFNVIPILLVAPHNPGLFQAMLDDLTFDDFLSADFQPSELQLRVNLLLRARLLNSRLNQQRQTQQQLFEMIIHDIGNLVTVMSSAISFYFSVPLNSPLAVQAIYDMQDSNAALSGLLHDLLDVTRLEGQTMPIKRRPTELAPLLQSVLDLYRLNALERNVNLELQIDPAFSDVNTVNIDGTLIGRVVGNLVGNALRYAPAESSVTVKIRHFPEASRFTIAVVDKGPGIEPERQIHLFDKRRTTELYKTHEQRVGHGLGLVFSRMAVEAHNGRIQVESIPGQGATFILDLPY